MANGSVIEYRGKRGVVWRIKWKDATGKQVMETVGREADGITRKQAEAELRERLVRVERKQYRRPKPTSFRDYSARWFEQGQKTEAWKPLTVIAYRRIVRHLDEHFAGTAIASIRPSDVSGYVDEKLKTFEPRTVGTHLSVLHAIFRDAMAQELVDRNPVASVRRPKTTVKRWRLLEPHEVPKVAKAFTDERARVAFLTLMLTGMRRHELLNLRWRDVSLSESTVRIAQSKSRAGERLISVSPALRDALEARFRETVFKSDESFVFAHPTRGSRMDEWWYTGHFRDALETAGVEGRIRAFHDARHAALTNLAAAGVSAASLKGIAGHSSINTTMHYVHLAGVVFPDAALALEERLLGRGRPPVLVVVSDEAEALQPDQSV